MSNFIVEFFEKSDGTYPAEEFILSQDLKMKSRLYHQKQLETILENLIPSFQEMVFMK